LTDELTRRRLLRVTVLAGVAVVGHAASGGVGAGAAEPVRDGAGAALHRPVIRVPDSAIGSLVPVFVSVPLPMTADHYVRAIEIAVPTDPVPSKGRVILTPACGEAYFYTQARVDEGRVELVVAAECNRHGRFESRAAIEVLEGG
jgi:desulfoferrodoxin (superoxide reductase-like protein)